MHINPDITAKVYFYPSSEGGRKGPTPPDRLGIIFTFEGENFDSRLLLDEVGPLSPGQEAVLPIAFLYPDLIKPRLKPGSKFYLRELGIVAEGVVENLL